MFDRPLKDNDYENAVLSGLAVLGADSEHGGWMPAVNYTPTLAAIITTMRAVVVVRAWDKRCREISNMISDGASEDIARQCAPSVFELV